MWCTTRQGLDIGNQLALTRLLLVIIALAIAVGQIVPYWVGRELRASPVVVVADADDLALIDETGIEVVDPELVDRGFVDSGAVETDLNRLRSDQE